MLTEDAKKGQDRFGRPVGKYGNTAVAVTTDIGEEVNLRKEALGAYTKNILRGAAIAAGVPFSTNTNKADLIDHLASTATNEQYENLVAAAQTEALQGEEPEEEEE